MSKGQQFWLELWREGKTIFHRDTVNADLITYWPILQASGAANVLVPLCGKSLDLLWLAEQGVQVTGIELSEQAVLQFADENRLSMRKKQYGQAVNYSTDSISIWVADIFSLDPSYIRPIDLIYDRAALIALPEELRSIYTQTCLQWLKPQGKILLKTMCYEPSQMEGPPFSVSEAEVRMLYKNCRSVQSLSESARGVEQTDALYERGLRGATDSVWLIQTA